MLRKLWKLGSTLSVPRAAKGEAILARMSHGITPLTPSVPTSILIPEVAALCQGKKSSLNGQPIYVVAAGGIYNGKSLAAALMFVLIHSILIIGLALRQCGLVLALFVPKKPALQNHISRP
jgi:hypothetical protein